MKAWMFARRGAAVQNRAPGRAAPGGCEITTLARQAVSEVLGLREAWDGLTLWSAQPFSG
jgi:hypothetical protein